MNVYIWTDTPWTVTETYTLSNIPTTDTNKYINVAKSWYTIQSVTLKFTIKLSGAYWWWVQLSSNQSNISRYWTAFWYEGWSTWFVRWRINWASDTVYYYISSILNFNNTNNNIEFYINRDWSWYVTNNWTTITHTATWAELNVIQTIMNLSNMNIYAWHNGSWATIVWNKVDVTVTYTPNS